MSTNHDEHTATLKANGKKLHPTAGAHGIASLRPRVGSVICAHRHSVVTATPVMARQMADKDPESEKSSESLSATAMFLRSFAPEVQQPATPQATPPKPVAETPRTGAGEFTRMFQALSPAEPRQAPPPVSTPAQAPSPSGGGDFTRAFVVAGVSAEQPAVPSKSKGFSTPGLSDSASAESSFTRIFRATPQPAQQPFSTEEAPPPSVGFETAPALPEATFSPQLQGSEAHPSSGVTELFRALSPSEERHPTENAYRLESTPLSRPYSEPTSIVRPDRNTEVLPPGGGVTALLNRLTAETPLLPSGPVPHSIQPPPSIAPVQPVDTRGAFTRTIQAAEVQAALAGTAPPPVASPSALPVPAPPAFPSPAPAPVVIPPVAASPVNKLKIEAPAVPLPVKSKLQEMVPLLLVANAFLMLILILLAAFALHRK